MEEGKPEDPEKIEPLEQWWEPTTNSTHIDARSGSSALITDPSLLVSVVPVIPISSGSSGWLAVL